MKVVVVESPAKAKTINKYLGKDYKVIASYGHMRDLPSKSGSVLPEDDFKMTWEISDRGKKNLNEILKAVKDASHVCLATDPDREGEAISWHLYQMLQEKKALKNQVVERVTFNEITQKAITTAFQNPRELNQELIDAYLARRALDYLVGFTLSPLLWRKLPGSRSAGRVQSVALRLITDRESEIESFKTQEYWTIDVDLLTPSNQPFTARLTHLNGEKLDKFSLNSETLALQAKSQIEKENYSVISVEQKTQQRNPYAPFITSTLQQEASRKLGMNATRTMRTAQNLYEGVDVRGETLGLITYMRTDGVQLSPDAIQSIRQHIEKSFGQDYLPKEPRIYKTKVKNAQEAHEAIRPTDISRTPDSLRGAIAEDEFRLYDLIWKRAVASQMTNAILDQVIVEMASPDKKVILRANGSMLRFDGFLKLYQEDQDDKEDKNQESDRRLPLMKEKDPLQTQAVKPEQHFTEPPPRYTEASLVKKMEELGIGRPSTYATILQVLQDRHYVKLEKKRFFPEERGRLVTSFLINFFSKYVQYGFTASMEEELDDISAGKIDWKNVLRRFWEDFNKNIDETKEISIGEILAKIESDLEKHFFPNGSRYCPTCLTGKLGLKLGRFGAFLGCSNYPNCHHTQQLVGEDTTEHQETSDEIQYPKILGKDPQTEQEISIRRGPFGVYLQLGEAENNQKPKRAPIPQGFSASTLTLEEALRLLNLPRTIGLHPETKLEIIANIGKFGPYLKYGPIFISVPQSEDILTMGLNRAVTFIAEKRPDIRHLGQDEVTKTPILLYRSKFGYALSAGGIDTTLPKGTEHATLTLSKAQEILTHKRETIASTQKQKEPAKKRTTKKAAEKSSEEKVEKKPKATKTKKKEATG